MCLERVTQGITRDDHSKSSQTQLFRKGFWENSIGVDTESCILQYSASPAAWLSHIFCSVPSSEDGCPHGLWDIPEYLETINYPSLDMPVGPTLKHREMM